ncbi:hypothetical protein CCMSSC00406_0004571 [Pleurotus cornucopiae]|uniref:Uncharacterized protein n=1 Tax=Pleurotus cornucopiae TaxID=5321 RepID=A0ACB7IWN7_PLECO|nr:hypothetical protein CCMSSC00406_0004571 [Pleurotus cornucopiae]
MVSPVQIDWAKVDQPELTPGRFPSRRSVVYGTKGVVSSSQPLATEAGLEILRKGGNAADAAVATSAALNVTEPSCCGVGGDAFCLFFDAKTRVVKALNGAAAAWVDTVEKFGTGKLSVAEVLEPAIRLAEEGVPVSEFHSYAWQRSEKLIQNASPNGDEMLLNGKAPLPGQVKKFPTLGQTFREIATKGKDGFYKGRVAEAIVELIQSKGGVMELDDLAKHETTFVDPISYTYAGEVTVYECPPNGQGITALLALGILEQLQEQGLIKPLSQLEHNSAEYLHAVVEAMRLAFADSQWYVTDPDFGKVPVKELLSKEYLAARAATFDSSKANDKLEHVMIITVLPPSLGGKRPYHTIIPALATRNGELFLSYGVMGGYMQPQGHVQVLLNILRGFTVQDALDAPRFCISPGMPEGARQPGNVVDANSEVYFEDGITAETIAKLRDLGHDARPVTGFGRSMMGRGQIIQKVKNDTGELVWAAGSDLRADGHAAAQI